MNIIEAKNLVHDFIDIDDENDKKEVNRALDDVNISIEEGSFVAVLGHNGSGKSTFARHINALLMPTDGNITVDGMNTQDKENLWNIRQNAGMVFQNPDNQIIGTVVEEDVGFGPENIGIPTEGIWIRVKNALKIVGMTAYRKHSPNKLSGGQKQRVAIAGVVAMKPKCIIMDEPTAMLDPIGRQEVLEAVHKLNKEDKVTVILITHYMNEVIDADKVFVMDKGKVVIEGTPREVFEDVEKIKALGLDVPQVTEVAYRMRRAGLNMPKTVLSIEEFTDAVKKIVKDDLGNVSRQQEINSEVNENEH